MNTSTLLDNGSQLNSDSESEDRELEGKRVPFNLDDFVRFRVDTDSAQLLLQLRLKWHSLFLRRLRSPQKQVTQQDEVCMRSGLLKVLF